MHRHLSITAAVLALSLAAPGCSSDSDLSSGSGVRYLGLGESIAYGEDGFVSFTAEARPNGKAFVGYPDLLGKADFGGHYQNLGCPGATTNSFSSLDGADNGCRMFQADWLQTMHGPYAGTEADKADEVLSMNDVRGVTLSIGGNDLLVTLSDCNALTPDDQGATFACALKNLPDTIAQGALNLGTILSRIRAAGFRGPLTYVNLYSTYRASDSATIAVSAWNSAMAPVVADAGAVVADAFTAFANAAKAADGDPCAAGLLIPNPDPGALPSCDVHPSARGAQLLADTVKAVKGYAP